MTDIPPPEESTMDIHKPKPWHNPREFFKEVGTIVLGIVIAIALEQMVETWHWHGEVAEARKALAAEIAANQPLFVRRLATASCMRRQVAEAHAILDALEDGAANPGFTIFHRSGGSALLSDAEWESDRAAQTLTHFPRAELAIMSRYYAQLRDFKPWLGMEGNSWSEMSALTRAHTGLTQSDIVRFRGSLDMAESFGRLMTLNAERMLVMGEQLGIARPALDRAAIKEYCTTSEERFRTEVGR
jgi:hypothetical protein